MLTSLELFLLHGIEFTLRPSVMIIFEYHNDSDSKRHISKGGRGGDPDGVDIFTIHQNGFSPLAIQLIFVFYQGDSCPHNSEERQDCRRTGRIINNINI